MTVTSSQRYTADHPCPICNGHPKLPQGRGVRCNGYLSDDGHYARCSRERYAGSAPFDEGATPAAWVHYLNGDCKCGLSHDQSPPAARPSPNGKKVDKPSMRPVAEYDYQDADGKLVYQVVRMEPATPTDPPSREFWQRHPCPDKNGDSVWSMGDKPEKCSCPKIDRLLYRLPELLSADPDATVHTAEGEKDVDRLRSLGLVATCNSGGAGNWIDKKDAQVEVRHADCLQGRNVVVLPDNDQAGHDHGQQVAQALYGKVKSIRVLDLPDLLPKGDVSDWLDSGGTLDALIRIAGLAEEWAPVAANTENQNSTSQPPTLTITTVKDVQKEQVAWLWDKRIPRGKLTVFAGDPGLGKSYMSLDIATRISLGSRWPDGGQAPLGNVLLISAEDGLADTIRPRLDLLGADVSRIHSIATTLKQDGRDISLSLADHLEQLEAAIIEYEAMLLILDPLLAFTGQRADTYKSSDVRAILAPLAAMAERTNCAIHAILHLNKRSSEGNAIYRLTASLDFAAAARSVLVVGKHPDNPDRRVLAPVKSNLSAPPASLGFHFSEDGYFTWDGEVNFDANAILSIPDPEERTTRDDAKDFLRNILSSGSCPSRDVIEDGRQCGYNETTLRLAAKDIGVESARVGGIGIKGSWEWNLPKDTPVQKGDHLSKSDHLSDQSTPTVQIPLTSGDHLSEGLSAGDHLSENQPTKMVTQKEDSGTEPTKMVTPHTGDLSDQGEPPSTEESEGSARF